MATSTVVSLAQKYGIPPFQEDGDIDQWLMEIDLWRDVTELPKVKHGSVLYLSLTQKVRQSLSSLTREVLSQENGFDTVVKKLEELYAFNKDQAMFAAY